MSKLKIQNFGPITSGFADNDGFMNFRKVTVFIGNQGTGKSSVAKLFSTMSWLEKALFQERLTISYVTGYHRFVKEFCAYQNLQSYFRADTEIEYRGLEYSLLFSKGKLSIDKYGTKGGYRVPKVMYVPAERNFLSAVDNPEKLKGLPKALSTFREELERSQHELTESLHLPIGNARFDYDKSNRISRITGKSYKLRLSEASSGFQSFVPLLLVSQNLAASIDRKYDSSKSELSGEEQERFNQEFLKILLNKELSEEFKQNAYKALSSKFKANCFLNIVEELEQNLFPGSQKDILFKLLEFVNKTLGNRLVLTTHSPYVINYLTLAIKAQEVLRKINNTDDKAERLKQLEKTVPVASAVAADDAIVYELTEGGQIKKLATYHGLPSDNNYLNRQLEETNNSFADLLDLEAAL